MATYEVGQTLTSRVTVTSDGTTPANTGTTPTCSATLPDGSTSAATVVNVSTGIYQATLTSTQAGRYRFRWSATGANSGGFPRTDVVDVWPTDPRLIIPLADAKASLNVPASVTSNDDEITLFIAAATDYIENLTGPILTATGRTWTADGGSSAVMLPEQPSAITSVTVDGTATTNYKADLRAGIIYAGTGSSAGYSSFDAGKANVVVTYTVGGTTVPPEAVLAARELVRFWFATSQQGGRPAFNGTDVPGDGGPFFPSRRVADLLAPMMNAYPGMA